jgi:zinc transport system substrate-binding protein
MRTAVKLVFAAIMMLVFSKTGFAENKIPVFVSIVHQKYFVEQICKDLAQIQVMVQPDASPATYEPKPKQMAELFKARIYFAIGVPF